MLIAFVIAKVGTFFRICVRTGDAILVLGVATDSDRILTIQGQINGKIEWGLRGRVKIRVQYTNPSGPIYIGFNLVSAMTCRKRKTLRTE